MNTIGRGMVVAVGPRHSVKKLAKKKKREFSIEPETPDVKWFSF